MLTVNLICAGNIKDTWLKNGIDEFTKRLSRFCKLNILEVPESIPSKEKDRIVKLLRGFKIALCIEGIQIDSVSFAEKIEDLMQTTSEISFIIGSSEGLDEEVKKHADLKLSFSKFTFPHQMMRLIFLEQLYRAFTIINNTTYHK